MLIRGRRWRRGVSAEFFKFARAIHPGGIISLPYSASLFFLHVPGRLFPPSRYVRPEKRQQPAARACLQRDCQRFLIRAPIKIFPGCRKVYHHHRARIISAEAFDRLASPLVDFSPYLDQFAECTCALEKTSSRSPRDYNFSSLQKWRKGLREIFFSSGEPNYTFWL